MKFKLTMVTAVWVWAAFKVHSFIYFKIPSETSCESNSSIIHVTFIEPFLIALLCVYMFTYNLNKQIEKMATYSNLLPFMIT